MILFVTVILSYHTLFFIKSLLLGMNSRASEAFSMAASCRQLIEEDNKEDPVAEEAQELAQELQSAANCLSEAASSLACCIVPVLNHKVVAA